MTFKTLTGIALTALKAQSWLPSYGVKEEFQNRPEALIQKLFNLFIVLVIITAVGVLIFAGFKYVTSAGDSSKAESAQKMIMYAVIGIIVALAAAVIVNLVWRFATGKDTLPQELPLK